MAREEDFLLEFRRMGQYMKVIAIDAQTGTEASIMGPANTSQSELSRLAVQKLRYVLKRRQEKR